MSFETILERLHRWAKEQPDNKVWTFLNDKGEMAEDYTYKQLETATNALAEHLIQPSTGLHKGDRVMLVFFPGLDFSVSLLACFKAELIAVPVFPPDPRRLKKDLHHFISIQSSSGAKVALTNAQYNFVKKVEEIKHIFSAEKWPDLRWIQVEDHLKRGKAVQAIPTRPSYPTLDTISFLQYTSGSTSEPKGVMISHGNLGHNLQLIIDELKADRNTVNVAWLPQYHDMGLIGSYMGILYCGGTGYYLSPISFLKDPLVWIKAISTYHGTHTQAPNFAYALVARKYKEHLKMGGKKPEWDLRSLQHMINAAEPVDYFAIMKFYRIFEEFGLRHNVIIPTYGLAEHTVFVCSGGLQVLIVKKAQLEKGIVEITKEEELVYDNKSVFDEASDVPGSHRIVGCGYPGHGTDVNVTIVDQETGKQVEDLKVGEIWVHSPSKASGYWGKEELSNHDFRAVVSPPEEGDGESKNDTHGKDYLRTGDLGFFYKGELFICGRIKDLIIVGGSNHYPQDIEYTIERGVSDYIRAGCSAAFAVESKLSHTEEVAYVAELKEGVSSSKYEHIVQACRELVSNEHGIGLAVVCLLKTRSIPKTTSGKIARSWCKRGLKEGTLQIVFRSDKEEVPEDKSTKVVESKTESLRLVGKGGYAQVSTTEADHHEKTPPPVFKGASAEELRCLTVEEIQTRLESVLIQVSSAGPAKLTAPVERAAPLMALGLDSMTIVQYQGVLENRFHTPIPDEFMFSNLATLVELSHAVKEGSLTEDQKHRLAAPGEGGATAGAAAGGDGKAGKAGDPKHAADPTASTTIPVNYKQPLCPWFTCCY